MKKLMIAALLVSAMPAMAEYKPSPELQKCMKDHIKAGIMTFNCPPDIHEMTDEQRMERAYKKFEQALQTPEQRAALAAEKQAWLAWQAAKDSLAASYSVTRGGNWYIKQRTEELQDEYLTYERIMNSRAEKKRAKRD